MAQFETITGDLGGKAIDVSTQESKPCTLTSSDIVDVSVAKIRSCSHRNESS